MGFWKNVENELKYRCISRKELALSIEMKEQSLHKAIERDSEVSAIIALKISHYLNVSLEYLLNQENTSNKYTIANSDIQKFAIEYSTLSSRDKELINCLLKTMKNK